MCVRPSTPGDDLLIDGPNSVGLEHINTSFEFNRAKFRMITGERINNANYMEMRNKFTREGDTASELVSFINKMKQFHES